MKNILTTTSNHLTPHHPQILFEYILENVINARQYLQNIPHQNYRVLLVPYDNYLYTGLHLGAWYEAFLKNSKITKLIIITMSSTKGAEIRYSKKEKIWSVLGNTTIDHGILKRLIKGLEHHSKSDEKILSSNDALHYQLPFIRALHPISHIIPLVLNTTSTIETALVENIKKILLSDPDIGVICCANLSEDLSYPQSLQQDHSILKKLFTHFELDSNQYDHISVLNVFWKLVEDHPNTITPLVYLNSTQLDGNSKRSIWYTSIIG